MSAANRYSVNLSACPRHARSTPVKRGRWLTGSALGIAAWAVAGSAALAQAQLPGTVNSTVGGVSFGANNGTSQTITQTTQRAIINWNDFNITNGQTLTFDQQLGTSSIMLNRVTGSTATSIEGMLNANGQVWVLNPNGIFIGSNGRVSVRGFLGSTAGVTDADFIDGDNSFSFTGVSGSSITNYGRILATNGGYAVLAGQQVDNNNLIQAKLGRVVLAGVPIFTLDVAGDSLLSFAVDETATFQSAAQVSNAGTISAQGGKVLMTARAAAGLAGSVVNLQGLIEAQTATVDGNGQVVLSGTGGTAGEVVIDGGANATVINGFIDQNNARAGGVINVNSQMDTDAGSITVLGNTIDIGLTQQAKLLASGVPGADGVTRADAGTISIGRGLANTPYANAPLASRIHIGPQSSSNFDRSVDPNGFPIVEIQARAFGGTGRSGGQVFLYTESVSPTAQIMTSGFIDVQASGNFSNDGGANGTGGTVEIVTQNFALKPSGTIIANSVTGASNGGTNGGGGVGGTIRVAAHRIVTQGNASAPNDTRISASGNVRGGQIFVGSGLDGMPAVAGEPLAREIWIGGDSSLRASAADLAPGTTGGKIVIGGATDATGSDVYIDGGLSARGGNGGTIQTVGTALQITGSATEANINSVRSGVDAGGYAVGGTNGFWLISGSNLTVKAVQTPGLPDFITGVSTSSGIDGRVLGGALGSFLAGPTYGATDVRLVEFRANSSIPSALRIQGPIEMGGARNARLELQSQDEVAITAAINVDPSLSGKLNLVVNSGGSFSFEDDGLQGTGTRSIFTNGGSVSISAADVLVGADRAIDTSRSSGAGSIDIVGTSTVELGAGSALFANAEGGSGTGGTIQIAGQDIYIGDIESSLTTRIVAVGTNGGGTISIGGAANGGPLLGRPAADFVLVAGAASIEADGLGTANGGRINIWSDRGGAESATTIYGRLFARSGLQGGNGGTVEVGGGDVNVYGNAKLDTTATVRGGDIRVLGSSINISTNSSTLENPVGLFAWGLQGGGTIAVGGGANGALLGGQPLPTDIFIGNASRFNANAINSGNAGRIMVWADKNDPSSHISLGGSFAADGGAGSIEIGGRDILVRNLTATTLGGGSVNLIVGDQGEIATGYGNGYGNGEFITDDAAVNFVGGAEAEIRLAGLTDTQGGNLSVSGPRVRFTNTVRTRGGNIAVNTGNNGYVDIAGIVDASSGTSSGGSIDVALGARSNFYSDGTISTAGNRIALSGGNDTYIGNSGLIASNGGDVSLTVGHTTGLEEYQAGIGNYGNITTDGGDLSFVAGDDAFIDSDGYSYGYGYGYGYGGSFDTGGGNATFTVGNGFADIYLYDGNTGGGALTVSGGVGSDIELGGTILTGGGTLVVNAGDFATVDNYADIYTDGGNVSITLGNGSINEERPVFFANYGVIDTEGRQGGGGNFQLTGGNGSYVAMEGAVLTAGGSFRLTTGNESFAYIEGGILTNGGDISIRGGAGSSIGIFAGAFGCEYECYSYGYLDAGSGNVELSAESLFIASSLFLSSEISDAATVSGRNVRLNADNMDIYGRVAATDSISIASVTADRDMTIGGEGYGYSDGYEISSSEADSFNSLELSDEELDYIDAPTVTLGRADGTGAVSIFLSPDVDDAPDDSVDPPSTTIVQAGGVGGTITVYGQGATDANETIRLVAGSSITLADDFGLEVNGKLELISGGSFVNNAGADALTTPAGGQWLIYSADPSRDTFGGLLSGQTAIWGRGFSDVAANGIVHSGNRYAFGLAPTLTITAGSKTKTYGDALNLTNPALGSDYSVSGLIDAAAFGNVFAQDSFSGAVALSSAGSAATADAGSYTIEASTGGFTAPAGYNLAFVSGGLTVNRRVLTASLADVSKVYDGTTAATLGAANYSLAGFVNGDEASVAIANTSGTYDNRNVGSGKTVTVNDVTLSGAKAGNYEISGTLTGAVGTITPATLTYVANPVARRRGVDNPAFTGSVTGFVGGDTQATATTGTLAFTTGATIESPAGRYEINGGGLSAGNYVFVQAPGNATSLQVTDGGAVQQVTTSVIQQVATSTRAPTPTTPPASLPIQRPAGTTGLPTGTSPGTSLAGNTPPPPPPPAPPPPLAGTAGGSTSGSTVEATPPSPVGDTPPETPNDSADQGDSMLAEVPEEEQDEAPSEKRQLANTTTVVLGIDIEVPAPPRSTEVPGAEQSFSGSGNPAQW